MWFAGIDWADQHHDVVVVGEMGQLAGQLRVAHTLDGIHQLTAYLRRFTDQPEQLACVVETSHGLLVTALLEAGLLVYPVNPAALRGMRPPSGVKTDALDALLRCAPEGAATGRTCVSCVPMGHCCRNSRRSPAIWKGWGASRRGWSTN